jgi:DNA-directed RNA polymerase delta subunit
MVCLIDIKNDLLSMKVEDFYLKHIVKSYNWYFKEYLKVSSDEILDRLDCFKEIISKNF